MALDRFQKFQDTLVQPDPNAPSGMSMAEVRIDEHGPLPADRPSYVRGFLRKAWRVALVGAVGVGGLAWMNGHGASVIGPLIGDGDTPYDASINATYQFVERTVLGKQGALDQQKHELEGLSARWQAGGVFTVKPTVSVSYYHDGASDALSRVDGTCTVDMSMDENGRMTALGVDGGLDRSNDPEAIRNHRNYIFGHESAHCSFHRELAPFRGSGLSPAAEKFLNDWVFGASAHGNPVRSMFNETEADVMGELVMLQAAHHDEKAWQEVERDWSARTSKQRYEEAQQYPLFFDPHETAPALREMLDNRAKVEHLAPAEFRNYAYAVASRSVMAQLSSFRVRAMPDGPINAQKLSKDDPLRHGQPDLGALGWEVLLHQINPVQMRATVSEQALQMREEQLGLRTPIQGMGDTLPRRMAQQWVAQAQPFKAIVNGRPAVTFVNTPDGPDRQWAGKDGLDGQKVFYSRAGGAPAFRDWTAYQAFQQQVHWSAITAEIQNTLKADPASLALATTYAPKPVVIDLGLAKPAVASPASADSSDRLQAPALRKLPNLEQMGHRLDDAARKMRDTVMPTPSVARITARRPS